MKENRIKLKKGSFLVSQPFMVDNNFRRTVIFLAEYNDEGALGFIINRPLEYKADELIEDFPDFDVNAFFGGPVETNTLHYIHRMGNVLDNSIEIKKGIFWGGDFEKLKVLISSNLITPKDLKFYVGYTGWSPGQLEDEIIHGSWVVVPADTNFIFNYSDEDTLWKKVLENMGDNFKIIAQIPETFFPN